MGSVIDYIECPNCKQEAFSDFYYKTGEEYVNCTECGYHHSVSYKRDDNGCFVTLDGTDDYSFDNLIIDVNEIKNPYGAYRIKSYKSIGMQCGSLSSKEDYDKFVSEITSFFNQENNIEFCSVSRLIGDTIIKETLIDNGPEVDSSGFTREDRY